MAALPQSTDFTGAGITEAGFKTAISSLRDFLSGLFSTTGTPSDARQALGVAKEIQPISASVSASALTITLNPTVLDFRATPLTSGTVNTRTVASAISLTISSGSTLGTVSAQQSRIAILAIDNAGTVELAAVNIAGGNDLTETGLISTTAEGGAGAADSATVVYSATARSNLPYRVVGYVESTQATAGTWATAPSTIQGYGGQAFAAMSSIGYGQTWQNVTGSRSNAVTYYNTTGRPIAVNITCPGNAANHTCSLAINGIQVAQMFASGGAATQWLSGIVPPGGSYVASIPYGASVWSELR